ncbi:MAG: hypothetical protein P8J51_06060 [Dehalococcoidia bacterium]|nr:hypothetical protein [Dehalococcoidia bacterium]
MNNILIWQKSLNYEPKWTNDIENQIQRGFYFEPENQTEPYKVSSQSNAGKELGQIGSKIRKNNHILLKNNVSTRDMLGCSKTRSMNPQTKNQHKRTMITNLLIENVLLWIHRNGSLTNKHPIYLDEWTTSIVMFEWIYEFIEQQKKNMVKVRIEYQENNYKSVTSNMAKIMIDEFINKRLEMLDANTLLWALWSIADNDLSA